MRTASLGTVAVIGGGLGGVAAALAAADAGATVWLSAQEPVLGGQITAQATSPLDEHPLIETTGAPGSYQDFRQRVRQRTGATNPGGGWVSRLCFEPRIGLEVIDNMIAAHVAAGRIRVMTSQTPVQARTRATPHGVVIDAVELSGPGGATTVITADIFIDATELGDLLTISGADTVIGSEGSDAFGESLAVPGGPDPRAEQSCTWVAALRLDPATAAENPPGTPPADYARLARTQPFSLTLDGWDASAHHYRMFDHGPDGRPPFWTYRRVHDASQLGGHDAAVINWAGNDYAETGLVADPQRTHEKAKRLTEAFVHWLRTDCPRDDGGYGYPELVLAPDITGSPDGFAISPYVRESRRLASENPITQHDISPRSDTERASPMTDALGTAWYHADLHPRVGVPQSVYAPTAPFQIPARALVPAPHRGPINLVAGAKNIAATQIAAAAYRVHPGEWSVGEAAGTVAAASLARASTPSALLRHTAGIHTVQDMLLDRGTPLIWARDLPVSHPAFAAANRCILRGGVRDARAATLDLRPDDALTDIERAAIAEAFALNQLPWGVTWAQCVLDADARHRAATSATTPFPLPSSSDPQLQERR